MDQKLQNLLYSVSSRTAWIIFGSCAAYWLICLTGVLTPPVSVPPNMALFWFYAMLMLALASGVAAVAAAALLLMRRRRSAYSPAAVRPAAEADDGPDQLAGLGRMLEGPATAPGSAAASGRQPAAAPKRKPRKRRR